MRKIIAGLMVLGVMASSTAFASPLAKLEAGKGKIDASLSLSPGFKGEGGGRTEDLDGKTRYRLGAVYGIGDNMALDYTYAAHEGNKEGATVQSHQINLDYQLNDYVTAFGGYIFNKLKTDYYDDTTNGYQVGLVGRYGFNDKTTGWAKFGIGNTITQYEVGVGYDLTNNWEANLSYNDSKYKDFKGDNAAKTHAVNLGVSYKF